jgi:hypothetical protein
MNILPSASARRGWVAGSPEASPTWGRVDRPKTPVRQGLPHTPAALGWQADNAQDVLKRHRAIRKSCVSMLHKTEADHQTKHNNRLV